ncbi:HAD family hydrolase [Kriegella aquimaris]|uniref:Putative hydrolase of the HAD superfamily n=1 Tax=Kriegella aquimaris TaxID=192904 RepID=A0A1G9TPM7_9FLAO|nr:HAD family hydrolase [Kriegella aquimaris]SDM49384.1 putative hydrolase of the HAD superfamily [Kriegella aquimaris]
MYIFFDLDDTLVDSESAHRSAIEVIFKEYFLAESLPENTSQIWIDIMNHYLDNYFKGEITLEQQRIARVQEFWKYFAKNLDDSSAKNIYIKYHKYFLTSCLNFDDTVRVLQRLSHFSMGILSNGTYPDQLFKINNNNLHQYFDQICISDKVGYSKPDERIFYHAAKQANRTIGECIYIGNSYNLDYLGSLNAGMQSIWLDRHNNASTDFKGEKISTLDQLPNHPIFRID